MFDTFKRPRLVTLSLSSAFVALGLASGSVAFGQSAQTKLGGEMATTQGLAAFGKAGGTLLPSDTATSCEDGKRLLSGEEKRNNGNNLPSSLLDEIPGVVDQHDTVIVGSVTVICQ
jgi:hypothetical protein